MTPTRRLRTRLLRTGLSLMGAVALGGGAGILALAMDPSLGLVVSVSVVAGCVIAVLIALLSALSAVRRLPVVVHQPLDQGYQQQRPVFVAPPSEQVFETVAHRPQPAPLWPVTDESATSPGDDPGQRREVFVKLARRLQSLINRSIQRIDQLEQENEDPVLLDGLYEIDHLFTLARRQGENLAVLGGEPPQRRSNRPVSVYAVLLAAVSEAEHYRQIAIVPVDDVEIHGHAVAEVIHLLAELLENATRFTSPDGPKVEVRAHKVTAGLAIEVQDRGLGMSYEDLERINQLLEGNTRIDVSELLHDGRIGLAVVRELARRHGIKVRLQSNIFGGIAAAVVVPPHLLSEPKENRRPTPSPRERVPEAPTEPTTPPRPMPVLMASPAPAPTPLAQRPPAGRRHRTEPREPEHRSPARPHAIAETELPELPVRAPGRSYSELRAGANTDQDEVIPYEQPGGRPPPLPQRQGTHLREELLEPPMPAAPVPGHNTKLMATVQQGREHWISEQHRDSTSDQPDTGPTRGEATPWPTT
ncbi:sensor histidine kinase KdpD [Alloactinosynnema sp. L-07]|uniref:sensor histidine kinase n=1 Tax=Alloactinosynnema sp. L-07 TaxID=1653480 RepID=UPI0012F7CCDD|nr:sensor histidine kinase [Alloactinosynnema sp. L-07]